MPPTAAHTEILRHSTWVILLVFFCGGVALLVGLWLLRSKRARRAGWVLLFMGALAEGILSPGEGRGEG